MVKSLNSIIRSFTKVEKELDKFIEVTSNKAETARLETEYLTGEVTRATRIRTNIGKLIG